jgi:F-type H+-transporting ATPase subunit delta
MITKIQAAKRYARIFLTDKISPGDTLILAAEMQFIANVVRKNRDIKTFLENPVTPVEKMFEMLNVFTDRGGFSAFTKSLLALLAKRRRMELLIYIATELHSISDQILSRIRVRLSTAQEPSTLDTEAISKKIGHYFNKNVFVEYFHDPSLIGGFLVEGDGKLIDMSIKGQLDRLIKR